jgi:hypothetical protein
MSLGHEHHGDAGHHDHGPRVLPSSLAAPEEAIKAWRTRLLIVGAAATLISLAFLLVKGGPGHILRAYLMGFMVSFGQSARDKTARGKLWSSTQAITSEASE